MQPRTMNHRLPWGAACAAIAGCAALPFLGLNAGIPADAGNWVEVGVATNGVRALVDTDSIMSEGGSVEVQQRFVLPPGTNGRVAYVDQQVVYRCSSGVAETLKSTEYDAAGRVLRREGTAENGAYRVLQGTLPRYILDVLC